MNKEKFLILLGGYDLEMISICDLAIQHGQRVLDAKLTWENSMWEAYISPGYQAEIDKALADGLKIIGIELRGERPQGAQFISLDHHGEEQSSPSSIEQIAKLFEVELDRWQRLVAANDKGYIPAMEALCATDKEIQAIRKADRKAQGVTQEDEALAEKSIADKIESGSVVVVKSLTEKFSPIADRLYGSPALLIYTDQSLTYYGVHKSGLDQKYESLLRKNIAYTGGGDNGYFGIGTRALDAEGIIKLKDEIVILINELEGKETEKLAGKETKELFSHHIFMFPFKWEHNPTPNPAEKQKKELGKHDLERFNTYDLGKWSREKIDLDFESYNEYNYFYPHVRKILYDLSDDLKSTGPEQSNKDIAEQNDLIHHYEYKIREQGEPKTLHYCIKVHGKSQPYYLLIDSIHLNIYRLGTGVISFHLRNFKYEAKEDILKINQFGRRLYPPFFTLDDQSLVTGNRNQKQGADLLKTTKAFELAEAIWLGEEESVPDRKFDLCETFDKYIEEVGGEKHFKYGPFQLPGFIQGLFPSKIFYTHRAEAKNKKVYLRPTIDDRMFVACWYGNDEQIREIQDLSSDGLMQDRKRKGRDNRKNTGQEIYNYESNDWWYKYTFIDVDSPMYQNRVRRPELISNHTYTRWVDYGVLWGISRYSMVMLTGKISSGTPSFLIRHVQTMYYKMAELCLIQRATILSFSDEVTNVSDLNRSDKHAEKLYETIQKLYANYILFVNKIYFREVTAQEQGIDMYDMLQKHMRLNEDVKDLDQEIEELHNYAKMVAEDKNNYLLRNLTIIGAFFLPLGLMASIVSWQSFPVTFFDLKFTGPPAYSFLSRIGLMVFASTGFTFIVDWVLALRFRKKNIGKRLYCLGFVIGGILFSTRWWLSIFY